MSKALATTEDTTGYRIDDAGIVEESTAVTSYSPEHHLAKLTVLERRKNCLFYKVSGKKARVIMDTVVCPSKLTGEARLAWMGPSFHLLDKGTSVMLQVGHLSFDKGDTYWRWLEYLLPYCTEEPDLYALAAAKTGRIIEQRTDAKVKFLVELLWDPPSKEIERLIPCGFIVTRSSSKR